MGIMRFPSFSTCSLSWVHTTDGCAAHGNHAMGTGEHDAACPWNNLYTGVVENSFGQVASVFKDEHV